MNAQLGLIRVVITELHHGSVPEGGPIPSVRLADFTFDPLVSRSPVGHGGVCRMSLARRSCVRCWTLMPRSL